MSNHKLFTRHTLGLGGLCVLAQLGWSVTGCATEGVEADCPEMPVTDDPFDPKLAEWRNEAEEMGCVTPRGEPFE
jgi:hypothetical protein